MDKIELKEQTGVFKTKNGDVFGHLLLDGVNTSLNLRHDKFFHIDTEEQLHGELHDLTKVTLINCLGSTGSYGNSKDRKYFNNVFPHYIVCGEKHINSIDKCIFELNFTIDHADVLFDDFDAFGSVIYPEEFIDKIANANSDRKVITGKYPIISYFTGKYEIFSALTNIGKVSAHHSPTHTLGGSNGASIDNQITCSIEFKEPINFNSAIDKLNALVSYYELLIGHSQNLLKLNINTNQSSDLPCYLDVYISYQKTYSRDSERSSTPHSFEVLLEPIKQPEKFKHVLVNWFSRYPEWQDSRNRFTFSQRKNVYDVDRLIAAANMFDILPNEAFSEKNNLSSEVKLAKKKCREIFKTLPESHERKDILDALRRLGRKSLKHKIDDRIESISAYLPPDMSNIYLAAYKAVNCRNHFVHGTKSKINYDNHLDLINFFTDTLEFIFATSDLVDCGWDMAHWNNSGGFHPFQTYKQMFSVNMRKLNELTA